jgi:purine-cytosine permease-like protein
LSITSNSLSNRRNGVSRYIQFGSPFARILFTLLVGGGLYGFFGPNRQMGCDGVATDSWVNTNLVCPSFSALIVMSTIALCAAAAFWALSLLLAARDKIQK